MTAPIWLASPPEVHSTLLSTGPGAGPLLGAAGAWRALSAEYVAAADELCALLTAVQSGSWDGPTAQAYAAANAPYLAWLLQAGADGAATAARQETAAAAYTAALAAMPTLTELTANHATHAVLLATNFFGVNAIPIALNEADYARMWVQAAVVMSTYQAVAGAAAADPARTSPAPQIAKAHAAAADSPSTWPPLPPDTEADIMAWMQSHGYMTFYNNVIQPMVNALANNPFLQSLFNGFDPYLTSVGNPLSFLSPFNVAFALGYPMTFSQYAAFLSETFAFIGADLTAAFASGNPASIAGTLLFTAIEAIGTIITDTIALLKTLLEQAIILIPMMLPLLTAALAPLAAPLPGLAGLSGLAALYGVPTVIPPVVPPPVALALAPTPPPPAVPAPAPVPAPVPPATVPPPPAPPPAPTLPPPGALDALAYGYLVGGLSQDAKRAAGTGRRRRKVPQPDPAAQSVPEPAPAEPATRRRRRRAKAGMLGRGYEYMDLEVDSAPAAQDCGPLGFTGPAYRQTVAPAGLADPAADSFGQAATTPLLPHGWDDEQ